MQRTQRQRRSEKFMPSDRVPEVMERRRAPREGFCLGGLSMVCVYDWRRDS